MRRLRLMVAGDAMVRLVWKLLWSWRRWAPISSAIPPVSVTRP